MFVTILDRFGSAPYNSRSQLFLTWDDWNDYSFRTLFGVFYVNEEGEKIDLGGVKIAYYGQTENQTKLEIGDTFDNIDPIYFSLGGVEYYEKLNKLGDSIRDKILRSLNDIAKYPEIYEKAIIETVTEVSLLRSFSQTEVTGQLRRIANGGAFLTPYNFYFKTKIYSSNEDPVKLEFAVSPNSKPPSNINVIIGRNGSGKTTVLNKIVNTLLKKDEESEFGETVLDTWDLKKDLFPALINVSFSAFDNLNSEVEKVEVANTFKYYYIGLKKKATQPENRTVLKSSYDLCLEFFDSLNACKKNLIETRWQRAIVTLESDSNFKEENIISLINEDYSILNETERHAEYEKKAISTFSKLSSGHKVVLLTITRLVELIEEKTLVLIDEPETHLHPPLL
ncbi:MAG: ATP-binding protein, partial [Nitrosopumilus sp.]|nr:ATP-binding protein [Nitrosopumilus sp.]